jgi:hypothetical protein
MSMSYLRRLELEIIPHNTPEVKRNCPKCKEKTQYISTDKFRVNANHKLLDVWLIYQCSKCKSTWNMTIYERVNPKTFNKEELLKFQENNKELALSYGYNHNALVKNHAEILWNEVEYSIKVKKTSTFNEKIKGQLYVISNPYDIPITLDKLLSVHLGVSRNKIRKLIEQGKIYSIENKNIEKVKVYTNLLIGVLEEEKQGEVQEEINYEVCCKIK